MSINVKDLSSADPAERYVTNPALTMAKKVTRAEKERIDQIKEEILQPKKDDQQDDKKKQVAGTTDSSGAQGDGSATSSQNPNATPDRVSIVV